MMALMESAAAVRLTPVQETVMRLRLGMDDDKPKTIHQVGLLLDMDIVTVSRNEREALAVLVPPSFPSVTCPECGGGVTGPHEPWCKRRA
jgi:DNA-directed RNA polymerase sigma subunit (sigma70/sigma32)